MKVLFTDDDQDLQFIYKKLFLTKGHIFLGAHTAQEAITTALQNPDIDVCVTDYMLPDLLGPTLISQLSTILPHSLFVLMTSHDYDFASAAVLLDDVKVIQKPLSFLELEQRLLAFLDHRQAKSHACP